MSTTILTVGNNGSQLKAHPADEIVVRLRENPSTGFRWQIDQVDGPLTFNGESFVLDSPPQIGGGGVHEFRFLATAPGSARLALRHWQAWEGESSVRERFSVDVTLMC